MITEFKIEKSQAATLQIKVYDDSIDLIKETSFQDSNGALNNRFVITNIALEDISKIKYSNSSVTPKSKTSTPQLIIGIILFVFGIISIILINNLSDNNMLGWLFGMIMCIVGVIIAVGSYKKSPKSQNGLFQIFGKRDNLLYEDSFLIAADYAKTIIDTIKKVQ